MTPPTTTPSLVEPATGGTVTIEGGGERRRVLKWTLYPIATEVLTGDVPRFLAVGTQRDHVVVWAEATVGESRRTVLTAVMTGEEPPTGVGVEYIGTTTVENSLGRVVVHVYHGPSVSA